MFLTRDAQGAGQVKILDFGIAKMETTPGQVALTASSVAFGSPQYMSPEQLRSTRDVDARSDLWSLGVCFYELLTGAMPFEGASQPLLFAAILAQEPTSLRARRPEVPADLAAIVARCLAKEPADRWPTAVELRDTLASWSMKNTGKDLAESRAPVPSQRMTASPAGTSPASVDRTMSQDEWEVMTGVRRPMARLREKRRRGGPAPGLVAGAAAAGLLLLVVAAVMGYLIGRAR
jgi:serine/threonine-protein kinase